MLVLILSTVNRLSFLPFRSYSSLHMDASTLSSVRANPILPLFLYIYSVSWASSLVFLPLGPFVEVLPSSISRIVQAILRGDRQTVYPLDKFPAVELGFEKFCCSSGVLFKINFSFISACLMVSTSIISKFIWFFFSLSVQILSWVHSSITFVIYLFFSFFFSSLVFFSIFFFHLRLFDGVHFHYFEVHLIFIFSKRSDTFLSSQFYYFCYLPFL